MTRSAENNELRTPNPVVKCRVTIAFASAAWSYVILTRFTDFFMATEQRKLGYLVVAFFVTTVLGSLVFSHYLRFAFQKIPARSSMLAGLAALITTVILLAIFIPPLNFPESHKLEIQTQFAGEPGLLEIIDIRRVELPSRQKTTISLSALEISSGWQASEGDYPLIWSGEPGASIVYTRFMQAAVEIVFRAHSGSVSLQVIWDGESFTVNPDDEGIIEESLFLKNALNWMGLPPVWKILVGVAIAAHWAGLTLLIWMIFLFPLVYSIRSFRDVTIVLLAMFLLIPLANAIDPAVTFKDPRLEEAIRTAINRPDGLLRQRQLGTLAVLDAGSQGISNLDGIEYLRGLELLNLRGNQVADITPIAKLTRLKDLDLRGNQVIDINPLSELTELESLNLRENPVLDIRPLAGLTNLRKLNLHGVRIGADVNLLRELKQLESLNIRGSGVADISVLADLMAAGVLQDDNRVGLRARVDIRDNPIPHSEADGYALLGPFWSNISERAPFQLPVFNILPAPLFSKPGGFYEKELMLILSSSEPDALIYYTLDGSEPTPQSPQYTDPIQISDRSADIPSLALNSQISPQWRMPLGAVDQAVVVRARTYLPDGSHSPLVTQTYFVGGKFIHDFALPVFSLVIDPAYLFSEESGIYTLGRVHQQNGRQWGNFRMQGAEWERPASLEYYSKNQALLLAQNIGMRIHGATTRSYPQKSLRLYADKNYDEAGDFPNLFFPDLVNKTEGRKIENFRILLLRNSGNNWNFPMFRDNLLQALVSHTSLDLHAYTPVNVFLNGEYWGMYNLREYLNRDFLSARYQLEPENIVILENDAQIVEGQSGDEDDYREMLRFIKDDKARDAAALKHIASMMDLDNFIDYQIAQIYARNENWPFDNVKYWHYQTKDVDPLAPAGHDGRWRWLLHDLDTAFGVIGAETAAQDNSLVKAEGEFLLRSLLEYEPFRVQFINRFADHLNTTFLPERVVSTIDAMQSQIAADLPRHLRRWAVLDGSLEQWESNVQVMREFALQRPGFLRDHIIERFGLPGSAKLTIIHDSSQGTVIVNSIEISEKTPGITNPNSWSGNYFMDIPIALTAVPKPGYEFEGWQGLERSSGSLIITLEQDLNLRALFVPASP